MSVYVDELSLSLWRYMEACHLFADTILELHDFATAIGLERSWFQDRQHFPHYDLTRAKRRLAVVRGAMEVDKNFVVQRLRLNRRLEGVCGGLVTEGCAVKKVAAQFFSFDESSTTNSDKLPGTIEVDLSNGRTLCIPYSG